MTNGYKVGAKLRLEVHQSYTHGPWVPRLTNTGTDLGPTGVFAPGTVTHMDTKYLVFKYTIARQPIFYSIPYVYIHSKHFPQLVVDNKIVPAEKWVLGTKEDYKVGTKVKYELGVDGYPLLNAREVGTPCTPVKSHITTIVKLENDRFSIKHSGIPRSTREVPWIFWFRNSLEQGFPHILQSPEQAVIPKRKEQPLPRVEIASELISFANIPLPVYNDAKEKIEAKIRRTLQEWPWNKNLSCRLEHIDNKTFMTAKWIDKTW